MAHQPVVKHTEPDTRKPPAKSNNASNGSITIKIQLRTHALLDRIINLEAEQTMAATGGGGCEGCIEEFKKRIPMTEIIHRAVTMLARAKGLKP